MNSRHHKTLKAVFSEPANGNLEWDWVESLFVALGCRIIEGKGSAVTFEKDGLRAHFHRPDPQKEALRYRVEAAREFLVKLEVKP